MNKITVTAKTIEEAITKATIELGLTSSELSYDVVEKGSVGFLGLGAKNCVIQAYKKEEIIEEIKNIEPVKTSTSLKKEDKKTDNKEEKIIPVKEVKIESKEIESKKKNQKIEKPQIAKEVAKIEDTTIDATKKFIIDVLASMNIEASVTANVDEEGALSINIDGKGMGVLIGKRGQTLDSLQYLANRVANKEQDGYIRVKLDTENYRERRKKTLENLAKNISYKVKKTRKPVVLEPMNPYERRIIHSALQDDYKIETHSEGEEPYRKVVVTLARK